MIVQCPCRGLKGDACPRCRGFGSYVAPDRYDVPPRRLTPIEREDLRAMDVVFWLFVIGVAVIAIAGAAWLLTDPFAAPRSSSDPTARPPDGTPAALGDRRAVGASDRSSSGAPLTQAVSPGPSVGPRPGRQAGGAPPLRGVATWYDAPSIRDAAAGPALRRALGRTWRGTWVRVMYAGDSEVATINVRLTDWCACGPRGGRATLLDLDNLAFSADPELGGLGVPLGRGVIRVTVESIDGVPLGPELTLPPTETEP